MTVFKMGVFIFDKDTAELLAQFSRLKQTIFKNRIGLNRFRGKFLKPFKKLAAVFYQV